MNPVKHIFLVEDDLDDQEFFVEALNGLENVSLCGIANNGKEALERLNNNLIPDLIFMDVQMPYMDGIECLAWITQSDQIKHIPVIMLSTAIPRVTEALSLGARGFIEKPSDIQLLKVYLEKMINLDYSTKMPNLSQDFMFMRSENTSFSTGTGKWLHKLY